MLIGLVALRLEGDYLAIVTLFVGQAFVEFVNNVDSGTLRRQQRPLRAGGRSTSFGGDDRRATLGYYYVALIVLIVLMAGLHLLERSRTGRAWRARARRPARRARDDDPRERG